MVCNGQTDGRMDGRTDRWKKQHIGVGGPPKNNVEKEINDFVETNRNELELKSNGNSDYNNEKEITTVEKQLVDLHRRHQKEYLDYRSG